MRQNTLLTVARSISADAEDTSGIVVSFHAVFLLLRVVRAADALCGFAAGY
jgi:hypothetical protein